jgi:hypothetical protein
MPTDLERSHDELRAALILAGRELRKQNRNGKNTPLLQVLRRVLRDARLVRKLKPSQSSAEYTP